MLRQHTDAAGWRALTASPDAGGHEAESLSLHEAVPGHHYRLGWRQQLTDLQWQQPTREPHGLPHPAQPNHAAHR
ncbi:hypothetical protein EBA01_09590 [Xanthomonas oryzae pv. oryzae]|nr:hypothetical protein C0L89_09590 [Xanthomonas oryzae pv. oryzae]AVU02657.1 hypothetical protein C0L90_09660 [Xanthomonas oryzae pv. oryzae]QBI12255.1 hypothetical protein EYR02_09670 [Xanthomonas oryzae pv. oryzae]QBI15904.1 hypothetical protein EYR03_10020 [Xanthomonas oryzae pv. oryzae]QBN25226.1 hypothetical protein EBA00_12855 [Xanthomonas oryzae pv. oryzae]